MSHPSFLNFVILGKPVMLLTDSELEQLNHLKKKSPEQRFGMMLGLIHAQMEAMKAGLKYTHKPSNALELQHCLQKKMQAIYSLKP